MSDRPAPPDSVADGERRFRNTLARVLAVQVIVLLLLWLLQAAFSS